MYAVLGTVFTWFVACRWRTRWPSSASAAADLRMMLVISTMMLPPQVIIIPMYLVWAKQLDLSGTLWPLIIPMAFGDAFSIFLLRQFLLTIPEEYLEAAKVDGCGELRTLLQGRRADGQARASPPSRSSSSSTAGTTTSARRSTPAQNPAAWTLSYGLESFKGAHHANWNLTMAATVLVMAPVIVVFFFAQKAFVEGVTLTGVKGT